eukprot:759214-Hanusia_phi.AAC.7
MADGPRASGGDVRRSDAPPERSLGAQAAPVGIELGHITINDAAVDCQLRGCWGWCGFGSKKLLIGRPGQSTPEIPAGLDKHAEVQGANTRKTLLPKTGLHEISAPATRSRSGESMSLSKRAKMKREAGKEGTRVGERGGRGEGGREGCRPF